MEERNDNVIEPTEDTRVTIGAASRSSEDFSKIITGGNGEADADTPKAELSEEEKRAVEIAQTKKFHLRYKPKAKFTVADKQKRQKKNRSAKKSKQKNR